MRDVTLRWLDSTARAEVESFWDAVKDGAEFEYVLDDSVRLLGTGPPSGWLIGDGYLIGDDVDGNAITTTTYVMESTELVFTPGEVDGFWDVTFTMREAV
jgi:hypothetical protein